MVLMSLVAVVSHAKVSEKSVVRLQMMNDEDIMKLQMQAAFKTECLTIDNETCSDAKELHRAINDELNRRQIVNEALFVMKDVRASTDDVLQAKAVYSRMVKGGDYLRHHSMSAIPVADLIRELRDAELRDADKNK